MDYTMLIAVIGCVTGIASLLIEAAQFFAGRSKAKFDTFDELNNFIYMEEFVVEDDDRSKAGKVVHCFLNLRVMNTGGRHILIQDVYMIRPGGKKNERKCLYSLYCTNRIPSNLWTASMTKNIPWDSMMTANLWNK